MRSHTVDFLSSPARRRRRWSTCRWLFRLVEHEHYQQRDDNIPIFHQHALAPSRLGILRADLLLKALQTRRRAVDQHLKRNTVVGVTKTKPMTAVTRMGSFDNHSQPHPFSRSFSLTLETADNTRAHASYLLSQPLSGLSISIRCSYALSSAQLSGKSAS